MTDETTVTDSTATNGNAGGVTPPANATPPDASGASDPWADFDRLVEEGKTKPATPDTETKTDTPKNQDEVSVLKKQVEAIITKDARESSQKALADAVKGIREAAPTLEAIDSDLIDAYVLKKVQMDPRIGNALLEGGKAAQAVYRAVAKELGEKAKVPDSKLTEDRRAVRDAVKGISVTPPPVDKPDLSKMNNAEFRRYKESLEA